MKVGFVGAGKVGCSFAKHFSDHGVSISGFYSRSIESAASAADLTKSNYFSNLETLIEESDLLFLTVPDDAIAGVWEQIKHMSIAEKMICHCSGSLSSRIFSGIENANAFGFSVHPLLAVSDRYESYQELPKALITIEGEKEHLPRLKSFLESTGLTVCEIGSEAKVRYHGAAVIASNLVVGLLSAAEDEFSKCGLPEEYLGKAMESLVLGNVIKVLAVGGSDALTGPVERNDVGTVKKHLDEFDGINREIYRILSRKAVAIAQAKHPDYNYMQMEELLNT